MIKRKFVKLILQNEDHEILVVRKVNDFNAKWDLPKVEHLPKHDNSYDAIKSSFLTGLFNSFPAAKERAIDSLCYVNHTEDNDSDNITLTCICTTGFTNATYCNVNMECDWLSYDQFFKSKTIPKSSKNSLLILLEGRVSYWKQILARLESE